jgi:hypothetical protein
LSERPSTPRQYPHRDPPLYYTVLKGWQGRYGRAEPRGLLYKINRQSGTARIDSLFRLFQKCVSGYSAPPLEAQWATCKETSEDSHPSPPARFECCHLETISKTCVRRPERRRQTTSPPMLNSATVQLHLLLLASLAGTVSAGWDMCPVGSEPAVWSCEERGRPAVPHVRDATCGMNDPNGPFFDPVHNMYHLFYQDHIGRPCAKRTERRLAEHRGCAAAPV